MTSAFRTSEELVNCFPNLDTIQNIPIDPHTSWGIPPLSHIFGTLHIPERGEGPPTLSQDCARTRLGMEHMTPLFPVPPDTKVAHDLEVTSSFYDRIPTDVTNIPLTRSMTFAAGEVERDAGMPGWANTIQEAHRKKHGMPIKSMSFHLAASPADPDDPRSTQPQKELAHGLRGQGFFGLGGPSELKFYRLRTSQLPLDISCLTDPELARAYAGLSHLSLGVEHSNVEQLWTSAPILPKSLQTLNLRYNHGDYPNQEYRSQLTERIAGSHATKVTFSCDGPRECGRPDHHG